MPWTPMAVSAWRTSSSLNGLMIATTSFMGGGLSFHHDLGSFTARQRLPIQIWHLSVQMAQKSCRRKWNHLGLNACVPVQATAWSATMRLFKPGIFCPDPGRPAPGQQVGGAYV